MSTLPKPFLTPEEYLEIDRAAEYKSEYYEGVMYAMAGASLNHGRIFHNLARLLSEQLRGRRCEVAGSDLRLNIQATGLFTYPDLVVFCGAPKLLGTQPDTLTDATLIIEILSRSTRGFDHGFKFENYRRLPSLNEYIMVAQDHIQVEHFTRQDDGSWTMRETSDPNAVIQIASIECHFRVGDAYERVEFGGETTGSKM